MIPELDKMWRRYETKMLAIDGASNDTIHSYRSSYRLFKRFIEENDVSEISTETVEEFLIWLHDQGYSPNSIKRHYYALKKFLCYIGYCSEINWEAVRPRGAEHYDYVILTEEEVKAIIDAAFKIKPMYGLMLWVGYEAALRASELVSLRVRQVDLQRKAIIKKPVKREMPCEAPISDDLAAHLEQWITTRRLGPLDYLFTTKFGKPWRRDVFHRHVFYAAVEAAGLLKKYPNIRYHSFARHTRATLLLRKGVDLYTVNKILCHRILQTTMIYLHLARAEELRPRIVGEGNENR